MKDTWVYQANPTTNYGSDTTLYVGRDVSNNDKQTLVWFDLSDLPANAVVVSATLEMYTVTNLRGPASPEQAYDIWTDAILASWNETTVTWNTKPAASNQGDPPTSVTMGGADWFSWDVTNIAQGWISGTLPNHGILLRGDGSTQGNNWFMAYPSGFRSRLTVAYVTQGSPLMLPAQEDTWIDQAAPSSNYGGDTLLYVGRDASYNAKQTLLKFDTSALPSDIVVVSATLELFSVTNLRQPASPEQTYDIWTDAIHTPWNEMAVTWNNRPTASNQGDPPTSVAMGCGGCWFSWDVTNIVQGWATGALVNHGILLRGDASTQGNNWFNARPDTNLPRLTIYYEPAPPPPCYPMARVGVSGPTQGLTGTRYIFKAIVSPPTATVPFTYTWHATDQSPVVVTTSATSYAVAFTWATTGTKTVRATVQNCGNTVVATHKVTIAALPHACAVPLAGLDISGPTMGITGTGYMFTATAGPPTATAPITYTWQATGQSDVEQTGSFIQTSATFTWTELGPKLISVTAQNCGGAFVAQHTTSILEPSQLPDLVISDMWYEYEHEPPRIGYLIKNVGGSAVPAIHHTGLYTGIVLVGQYPFTRTLQPGAIRAGYIDHEWVCPPQVTSRLVQVCADDQDAVNEGDEGNNCWGEWWSCDLGPPQIISGPTVLATTEHTATIAWQTDEECRSQMDYSRSYYAPYSVSDNTYKTDHQVTLTGLEHGSLYYYQVLVTDRSGNESNSPELFFETDPPGSDPPQITSVDLSEYNLAYYEFYTLQAALADTAWVDRVEFYLDDALVGMDYAPSGSLYEVYLSPYAEGMTRESFFQSHTLEARAFTLREVSSTLTSMVTPPFNAMPVEVEIWYPYPGRTIYIDADVAPAGTEVNVSLRAFEFEWGCTGSAFSEQNPPGIDPVNCEDVDQAVAEIEIFLDGQPVASYTPVSPDDFDHAFAVSLEGKALGAHTIRAVAHASDQATADATVEINIARGTPSLEFQRAVTRQDNVFEVSLTVENQGAGTAYLDFIWDVVQGFEVIEKLVGQQGLRAASAVPGYYRVRGRFTPIGEERHLEIDLFDDAGDTLTLPPGETFVIEYVLVPVLYEGVPNYSFGATDDPNDQSYVQYSDGTTTEGENFLAIASYVNDPEAGMPYLTPLYAVINAVEEADYLLVTSPSNLSVWATDINWRAHDSDAEEVNKLLSRMAELASLQQGVLGYLGSTPDADTLDELLEPGGMWADSLHPDFRVTEKGYVLIVGEQEIVPAQCAGYGVNYSDLRYSSTSGAAAPELILGRIVGNDVGTLAKAIQASINFYRSGAGFDRSHAMVVSGTETRHENAINDLENKLRDDFNFDVTRIRGTQTVTDFRNAFKQSVTNQDVIAFYGHGNPNYWEPGLYPSTVGSLNLGAARPFVYAVSCVTGDYEDTVDNYGDGDDYGMAEAFLRRGATVYIGATSVSDSPPNQDAVRWFFDRWDGTLSIGQAFVDMKRDKWSSDYAPWYQSAYYPWRKWSYQYHLYGDPKFGVTQPAVAASAAAPTAIQAPQMPLQVHVPDYEVTTADGWDYVEIPGGHLWTDDGGYRVPYWSISLVYSQEVRVQDVVLTDRSGLTVTTGLNIPTVTVEIDCVACAEKERSITPTQDADWFPAVEEEYQWLVSENPDGSTSLEIFLLPFYYNPTTTDVRFYQDYTFDIQTITSTVEIRELDTDKRAYFQGEPVSIDLVVRNLTGTQDVIVNAVVKEIASDKIVAGLPLRNLHDLAGQASFGLEWDSANVAPGGYYVEVALMDLEGNLLDRSTEDFEVGITSGEVTTLVATLEVFDIGDTINVSMTFSNTGDVPITGTAVIRVQNTDTLTVTARFTHTVANLTPGGEITFDDAWDTTGALEGTYRVLGYVKYNGTTSAPRVVTVTTTLPGAPILGIAKTAPGAVVAGELLTYTIMVHNTGTAPATGVTITDTLPAHTTFASADSGGSQVGNQVQWTGKTIGAGSGLTVTFAVTVTSPLTEGTSIVNAAYGVSCAEGVIASGSPVATTVQGEAAPILGIAKTAPGTVLAGELLTYTVTAQNTGTAPATGVTITDTLPAHTTFASADSGGSQVGNQVQWTGKTIDAGGTLTVTFAVTVTKPLTGVTSIVNDAYGVTCAEGVSASGSPMATTVQTETGAHRIYLPVVLKNQ